ncbi:helix-turn-helix transcriptional regulator [Niameybacter massiliensis]|uniref:helix-turn-helix transcriptional regulator n=1 Tax=Niameybacter massiliensis TaxID=1658108 RepID=UPI0012B64222|nr:helix-turn-helix transcriptional regulator [Niameybacter massiliensis]
MINQRKKLGLTQDAVAEYVGVNRNTISSYETGKLTPSLDIALKLKECLKTNDDKIFLKTNVTKNDIKRS